MYRLRLEADEYVVEWARNGQEGLRLVHAWQPQLIFLDVRMPEMDGLQLLHLLRDDPATAGVPVVVSRTTTTRPYSARESASAYSSWRSKIDTTPGGMSAYVKRWSSAAAEDAETP